MLRRSAAPLFLALALPVFAMEGSARADASSAESPAPGEHPGPKTESRWYGYQTLGVDGGAIALGALAAAADGSSTKDAFLVTGLIGYATGGPIVHFAHGHVGKGFGVIAIRVLAPVIFGGIGSIIGAATYEPPPPRDPATLADALEPALGGLSAALYGGLVGAAIGAAGAITLDAAALAHEDVPAEAKESPPKPTQSFAARPSLAPTRGGASVGLYGTF